LRIQFHHVDGEQAVKLRSETKAVGGQPERTFSSIPLKVLLSKWDVIERKVLTPFFGFSPAESFSVGGRIRLRRRVERYPYASVDAGSTGVVVAAAYAYVSVRLDQPVEGLEEWDNELRWDERESALADLEALDESGQDDHGRRFFTAYWTSKPWNGSAGHPVDHAAANDFVDRGVRAGDVIYIVHYKGRELYVGARLKVGNLLSQREAEEHFGHEVWDASDHVLSEEGTEELLVPDRLIPRDVLRQLMFIRASDKALVGLKFDTDGAANQQTLRAVRELSPDAAATLDGLIAST
jgi:hypothetical protein